ncbi:unnamed protein product [Acanthoscelides obtectus]|uniref:Transposase n=1 Tax=Acanthoscelides obtectus TaxID=200917 RepID=A0A9P0KQN2_ACAOB|nr:unnamed protein product [Acanthoscelides obtectus]CAK1634354.1 Histone-lysine N-methyltransferase SETMAR [Acanthoscelides obtectus]
MELNREHFRTIIYYNFQRQLSQQECLADLSDDSRVGAPKTAVTQESVDAVRKLIFEDRHVTYREIEAKLVSRSFLLTEEQKAARVNWCQKRLERFNSGNSKNVCSIVSVKNVICSRSVSKKMVATFVSKAGHIATIPLNEQRTVTPDWSTTICLPKVITELRKINPERRIILHQDNASSHTAQKTRQYLTEENVELLDHPPYSPDLRPKFFFTFPKIKNRLRANEWNKCFENWFERMQMYIYLRGEFIE